jgi:tetratricopeptide (TPR) repeat protein
VADASRLEELRRRVQKDPTSLVFAQLAEEHRRAGEHHEAVRVCRAGLRHHPEYHSARVTLGRALLAMGQLPEAERELQIALRAAPENIAAQREMGELYRRDGRLSDAITRFRTALSLAPRDADLAATVAELERSLPAIIETPAPQLAATASSGEMSPEHTEPLPSAPVFRQQKTERLRSTLERWLVKLQADRSQGHSSPKR